MASAADPRDLRAARAERPPRGDCAPARCLSSEAGLCLEPALRPCCPRRARAAAGRGFRWRSAADLVTMAAAQPDSAAALAAYGARTGRPPGRGIEPLASGLQRGN